MARYGVAMTVPKLAAAISLGIVSATSLMALSVGQYHRVQDERYEKCVARQAAADKTFDDLMAPNKCSR